MTTPENGLQK